VIHLNVTDPLQQIETAVEWKRGDAPETCPFGDAPLPATACLIAGARLEHLFRM
jgi:hypothetical protein